MQRYLAETPQEDAATYARLVQAGEGLLEDKQCASVCCFIAQEENLQLDRPLIEANSSLIFSQFSTGCSFTGPNKICWVYNAYFGHLELEYHLHIGYGRSVLLTNDPHHVKPSETLFTSQKSQKPKNMPFSDSACSLKSFGAEALELWLHHVSTHSEHFTTPCELQIISKAAKGNTKPINSPSDSNSEATYEDENIRRSILRVALHKLLQYFTLVEDPKSINQLESGQTLSATSPAIIVYNPQISQGGLIADSRMNYDESIHNHGERRLLAYHFAPDAADSFDNNPRMEQQEQEDSTISDYSSSSSSLPLAKIFSLENSSNSDTSSASIFVRDDDEEAVSYNTMTKQASGSVLVDEFARFTKSWLIDWTANRRTNTGSNSHDQEIHSYEG